MEKAKGINKTHCVLNAWQNHGMFHLFRCIAYYNLLMMQMLKTYSKSKMR